MANVKSRVKAPKSAPTKRGRGNAKKSLTAGDKDDTPQQPQHTTAAPKNVSKPNIVMKRPSELKLLTTDEKVQFLLQNGHLLKDTFFKELSNIGDDKSVTPTRRGTKKSHTLINQILKSELMITDSTKKTKSLAHNDSSKSNNNNDNGVSNQNKHKSVNDINSSVDNSTQTVKKGKGKPPKKSKVTKSHEKKSCKTRQVTLSNGLVLSLSLFQCDHCNKTFTNKSSIRKHIYSHMGLKSYHCQHCTRKFMNEVGLKCHIKRMHSNAGNTSEPLICEICNKPFLLKENLKLHLASHIKHENAFKCIYCDKKFSHHLLLSQHEQQHLVTGRYQCTLCNMSYDCRNRLSLHVKSHLQIKDYICQFCGKEFLRANSLTRHLKIYHGGRRIQCPVCNKKLKGHLTEHLRTHEKRRPHECAECGQRFTQSTQLNVHRRSHTGARPYPCRICMRPFTHSNALMLHIRRHTGEKPFLCAMCPMSFSQLPHMKAHMRSIHRKENAYRCTKCDQFFKLKVQLDTHMKMCTVGDVEMSFEEKIQASVQIEEVEVESVMSLSRMRFLLALLLTMIASKEKLKYLGFNKRLIDEILVESLEAMGQTPSGDETLSPYKKLRANIEILLNSTVPKHQMEKFKADLKTTEELLELLTDEKTAKKNE